jgi:hypothetical protein
MKVFKMFVTHNVDRLLYVFLFAITFSVAGYYLPKIYHEFLDKTEYITIKQPVSTEFTEYKRGDSVGLILSRRALVDVAAEQSIKIVHVNGNIIATQLGDRDAPRVVVVEKTNDYVTVKTNTLFIPCNAIPGRNFIQAIFSYEVGGVSKTYTYISDVFTVLEEKAERCE